MVEPDTVVRWHRSAWRAYWRWKSRRRSGRPRIPAELRQLIVRIATEHPRWGAVRIVGELRALGFEVSARTVSRYRRQALRRPPSQSWRTFLRNHASSIWAADLFTVQTLAFRTLSVLIVIDHDRRRIRHWNVTEHPNAPWIWQQMIEATAWGQQPGFLIRDRDRSYGGDFIARARRLGIETILTPVHAPNANAIAERVIGTLRRECLDHVITVNEQHLEPPRECWRLQSLRGWSDDTTRQIPGGDPRAGGPDGVRARAGPLVAVGNDQLDRLEVRDDAGDVTEVGATG